MSWFSGGSSSGGGWFGVSTEERQNDQPLAKRAAKPTAVRDWEQQAITAEKVANAGSFEGPKRPQWNPFLSLEKSDQFDDKMRNMRQLKDQAPAGELTLRSYEQQVLKAPVDAVVTTDRGSVNAPVEGQEVEGTGKGIFGAHIPLTAQWVCWPPQRTRWTPAPHQKEDESGFGKMTLSDEMKCMGLVYFHQVRTYEYYEAACRLEFQRQDALTGHSAGSAGICFHVHHKGQGVSCYVYFVRLASDEHAGDELVLARLEAPSYDYSWSPPEEIEVLNRYQTGKLLVNDGSHYFRVRSFCGGLMFYFNHAFVGFYEVPEKDKALAISGHCGVWSWDLEVAVHAMVQKNLEEMELNVDDKDVELQTKFELSKVQPLIIRTDRNLKEDAFSLWAGVLRQIREERMRPYRHLQGAEKTHARVQLLAEWMSCLYTLQRFSELLNSPDHLKGRRLQLYLHELDATNPPPPPPPMTAPPTPEDEELHYLYEMQQRKYQKQIEDAGRKILGQEKFAELKNMAGGSLAQQQKDLVAEKQKQMAGECLEESQYQALTKMAQRLLSNFGEMGDLVPAMKSLRASSSASSGSAT